MHDIGIADSFALNEYDFPFLCYSATNAPFECNDSADTLSNVSYDFRSETPRLLLLFPFSIYGSISLNAEGFNLAILLRQPSGPSPLLYVFPL